MSVSLTTVSLLPLYGTVVRSRPPRLWVRIQLKVHYQSTVPKLCIKILTQFTFLITLTPQGSPFGTKVEWKRRKNNKRLKELNGRCYSHRILPRMIPKTEPNPPKKMYFHSSFAPIQKMPKEAHKTPEYEASCLLKDFQRARWICLCLPYFISFGRGFESQKHREYFFGWFANWCFWLFVIHLKMNR